MKYLTIVFLLISCAKTETTTEDTNTTCVTFYQYRKFISTSQCSGTYYLDTYNVIDKTYCVENYSKSLCVNSITCTPSTGGSGYLSYSRTQYSGKPTCASLGYTFACSYGFAKDSGNCYP
jgi:hypothetical protein